ncbi:MAG: 3'-5' exonuclease [Myxococcota bacterium]|jgi:DNA polymerase III epsilon subunit family exonuclease|nr:3'-5' exonuclease [Myxococcota bacterium]
MRWIDFRLVAFDTETTGLQPFDGDRIMEFAAVELQVNESYEVVGQTEHSFLINPEIPIPRKATEVTGITDEQVEDQPLFAARAETIHEILNDAIVVAHNLPFDLGFLRSEFRRCGKHLPRFRAEVDTLPLSQSRLPELKNHKLATLSHALRVELEGAHRAVNDALACGLCLVEISRRKNAPDGLDAFIEWSDGLGLPPDTGHVGVGERGLPEFLGGPHQGELVEAHPDYLHWMTLALERQEGQWHPRFPGALREWSRRWLRVRASGRARQAPRGASSQDWSLDPRPWATS